MEKVSIIMSVFNCAHFISEAIDSILNQTYKFWELIICDDGSTDGTWDVIKTYKEVYPKEVFVLRNKKNRGQAYARNKCIKRAKGSYIAIMDADDICDPTRLEKQVKFLSFHPEVIFVGTGMTFFDESGTWAKKRMKSFPSKEDYVPHAPFCLASCMFRKDALLAIGGYNESPIYRSGEDYELVVSLLEKGYLGANISEPLYFCREESGVYKKRKAKERIAEAWKLSDIVTRLRLPVVYYLYILRPLFLALLPGRLYMLMHRGVLKKNSLKE